MPRHSPGRSRLTLRIAAASALTASLLVAVPASATSHPERSWLPETPPGWQLVVDQSRSASSTISRGVQQYGEIYDTVDGRQRSQVLDLDLTDPNVRVGMVSNHDRVTDPANETISSMAARTGAIAGVNGDYFDINASGASRGGLIRDGKIVKSPRPNYNAQLSVRPDGSMVIGAQAYEASVTDGANTHAVKSLNVVGDLAGGGITRVTPDLGETNRAPGSTTLPPSTLVVGHDSGDNTFVVDSVKTNVTVFPALPAGQQGLAGAGEGGQWLASNVTAGEKLTVAQKISPDNDLTGLISGATQLVKDGKAYVDPTGEPPGGNNPGRNPETAVGLSKDGKHALVVVIDGRGTDDQAVGVTPAEATGYFLAHGVDSAILFDGGGSSEMIARRPGELTPSVMNKPSDGRERNVANGIFIYTTAKSAGQARNVVINGGKPVVTVPNASVPVKVYATDSAGNPASGTNSVTAYPSSVASYENGVLTTRRAGTAVIVARNGWATSVQTVRVVDSLTSLAVSPPTPDISNGEKVNFTLTGKSGSADVQIPSESAQWSVEPASLGSVDAHGVFTAAATGDGGMATVTAKVAGKTTTASVAVGGKAQKVADTADVNAWSLRNTTNQPATFTNAPGDVPPGSNASGSMKVTYSIERSPGVKQLVLSPKTAISAPADATGRAPTAIGVWIKGDGKGIDFAAKLVGSDGTSATLYPAFITFTGWKRVNIPVPSTMPAPISVSFIDFLQIAQADEPYSGELNVGGIEALYSPRPVVKPPYVAIPKNPSWLRYERDAANFGRNGSTILTGDDAHMLASTPESASANVMAAIAKRIPALPKVASPDMAQFLGDMPDNGELVNQQFAKSKMEALGIPFRNAVGNHEISQGAILENQNFTKVFGDTRYAYKVGAAQVIVSNSSHIGLQKSDPFNVPAGKQFPWLVEQLNNTDAKAILVVTHTPAYDPHEAKDSQFSRRWEAREYVRLVQRYMQTHPDRHVVMVYGHARGFSEQILDPDGKETDVANGGVPQLTFADLGMPAYAPADKGGFYHFGLVHTTPDGTIQFSVEPVLASIAIAAAGPVQVGKTLQLSATGTNVGGSNLPPVTLPIADPAAHVWSSSAPNVASVDPNTGVVTGKRHGTATISVTSGGVTASTTIAVD